MEPENTMSYALFSIDFENNPLKMNVFLNHIRALEAAGSHGHFVQAIGRYNGKAEHCFICTKTDFENHIRGSVFIAGQESVLWIASGNKAEAHLEYFETSHAAGMLVGMGSMHQVSKEEAFASDGFTYRPDLGLYWVAKEGNNDKVYDQTTYGHPETLADILAAHAPVHIAAE